MTYVDVINAVELVWWIACGIGMAIRSYDASGSWRRLGALAAFTLILFGLSDGVELYTKAWWNPWWLLVWKAFCLIILIGCVFVRFRWLRRRECKES